MSESESQEETRCAGKDSGMDLPSGCDRQVWRLRAKGRSVTDWVLDTQ